MKGPLLHGHGTYGMSRTPRRNYMIESELNILNYL